MNDAVSFQASELLNFAACFDFLLVDYLLIDPRLIDWIVAHVWWLLTFDPARLRIHDEFLNHDYQRSLMGINMGGSDILLSWNRKLVSAPYPKGRNPYVAGRYAAQILFQGPGGVRCMKTSGKWLITGSAASQLMIWVYNRQRRMHLLWEFHNDLGAITALETCNDRLCSSYERDQTILVRTFSGKSVSSKTLLGHTAKVTTMLALNGRLYSGSADNTIRQWNVETGTCENTVIDVHAGSFVVILHCNGENLISGAKSGELKVLQQSGCVLHMLPGHVGRITNLLDFEGFLVSASNCQIRFWEVGSWKCQHVLTMVSPVRALTVCRHNLVVGTKNMTFMLEQDDPLHPSKKCACPEPAVFSTTV